MKFRFLVFGAGAIGTYIGTSLLLQDHQVVFLEREKDLIDLRERGLKMEVEGHKYSLSASDLITDLNKLKHTSFDLAILALKTYHLKDILPDLVRLKNSMPPILCLQNGVESENILREALGKNLVIPGTVTTAVDRIQKGNIIVRKSRGIGIAGDHPLIAGLIPEFQKAGLEPVHYTQPENMKWSKLILNLLGNASSAILNMTAAEVYADPELFRMERTQILETLGIMKLLGYKTVNLPGVPVRLLAFVFKYFPRVLSQPILSGLIGGGRGEKMPSFHIDLHSGKGKSEVDHLNGAVKRAGKKLNFPTPANDLLFDILTSLTDGRESLSKYDHQPGVLLQALSSRIIPNTQET